MPVDDAGGAARPTPLPWRAGAPLPDEDATYSLIPTSGTTGRPKAVRVTGRMTGHAAAFYARTLGLTPADRTAIHLPFALGVRPRHAADAGDAVGRLRRDDGGVLRAGARRRARSSTA